MWGEMWAYRRDMVTHLEVRLRPRVPSAPAGQVRPIDPLDRMSLHSFSSASKAGSLRPPPGVQSAQSVPSIHAYLSAPVYELEPPSSQRPLWAAETVVVSISSVKT